MERYGLNNGRKVPRLARMFMGTRYRTEALVTIVFLIYSNDVIVPEKFYAFSVLRRLDASLSLWW